HHPCGPGSRGRQYKEVRMLNCRSSLGVLVVAATLWACSDSPAPQPTPPPQPAVSYDGRYVGSIHSVGSVQGQNWCDTPASVTIVVSANTFNYTLPHPNLPHTPLYNPAFTMQIRPDGSFRGTGGELEFASMSGQITGTHLVGQIDGSDCSYAFAADRR